MFDLVVTLLDGQLEHVATLVVMRSVPLDVCDRVAGMIVWFDLFLGIDFYGEVLNPGSATSASCADGSRRHGPKQATGRSRATRT